MLGNQLQKSVIKAPLVVELKLLSYYSLSYASIVLLMNYSTVRMEKAHHQMNLRFCI